MVRKALSASSGWAWVLLCLLTAPVIGCSNKGMHDMALPAEKEYTVDENLVPHDTILSTEKTLWINNGIYQVNNTNYSGIIKELYPGGSVRSYRSVLNGMLYGKYKSFYANGNRFEVRQYRNNFSTGKHMGYWEDGTHLKFEYNYYEEKREGQQKKWYRSGQSYLFANYVNDHEDGLQQAWRENGKLFVNYVARNGFTYGLQQTALCYTLLNEKIKSAE